MRQGRASRTAEHNALFRALESSGQSRGRLFEDPLARSMLTWPLSLVARLGSVPVLRTGVLRFIDGRWEGVTNYLTEAAVDATLRWCSRAARESLVLFTYVDRGILTHPGAYVGTDRLFASLAKVGEAFTFGVEPMRMPEFLSERGLSLVSDLGAADYRARYYGDASRAMRGHEFYHVALARVGLR